MRGTLSRRAVDRGRRGRGERWTLQIPGEMTLGATRFSELQRYLPRISASLLNARLELLEEKGVIVKRRIPEKRGREYRLSPAGKVLAPVLHEMAGGAWSGPTTASPTKR